MPLYIVNQEKKTRDDIEEILGYPKKNQIVMELKDNAM